MVLKLNGKPMELRSIPPTVLAVKSFLDKAPADEVSEEVAKRAKLNHGYIRDLGNHELLAEYTLRHSTRRFFGHPKAIAELKKQVNR